MSMTISQGGRSCSTGTLANLGNTLGVNNVYENANIGGCNGFLLTGVPTVTITGGTDGWLGTYVRIFTASETRSSICPINTWLDDGAPYSVTGTFSCIGFFTP